MQRRRVLEYVKGSEVARSAETGRLHPVDSYLPAGGDRVLECQLLEIRIDPCLCDEPGGRRRSELLDVLGVAPVILGGEQPLLDR